MILTYLTYIVLSIGLVAFFSGSETALISIKFMKLVHLIEKKNKSALLLHKLLKRPDTLLAMTLIGTNIAVILASAFTTELILQFNQQSASFLATCLLAPLILIFGEIIPKTICQNRANQIALIVAPLLVFMQKMLWPFIAIVRTITNALLRFITPQTIQKNPFLTRDEIKTIIRDVAKEGIIEDYERNVIDSIFDFTLTKAADIMVPLKEVALINYGDSKEDMLNTFRKFGFTRLPVFQEQSIKGVINIFDIFYSAGKCETFLTAKNSFPTQQRKHDERSEEFSCSETGEEWHTFIRPLRSVAFNERLDVVFSVMQPNKETMVAVLKDNSCVGILTIEDLIDEIVHRAKPLAEVSQTTTV